MAAAVRKVAPHVRFGMYHSLYEWFHPLYVQDKQNKFATNDFVKNKMIPEMIEMVRCQNCLTVYQLIHS